MSERKVLTKYYPADFDPSALGRRRKPKDAGPKVQTVRLMAPFSMRCMTCGEYIYRGKKFNARKETPEERYLSIQIFRFYIRCPRCSGEIIFKTDPKNQDYRVERGAKRNTEPWRAGRDGELEETDDARLDRLEREQVEADAEENGERDAMAELEASKADAKERMAVADQLEEMRYRNARIERANRDGLDAEVPVPIDERRLREEKEDEEAAKKAFAFAKMHATLEEDLMEEDEDDEETEEGGSAAAASAATIPSASTSTAPVPAPTFKRQVKKKKDHSALLGIKKKKPLV
ncbi:mRNA splicing protein Yju2 [Thozetella sp. PMI_491]|nr:mRNA splicing protein Yju2 [Thozetella sp. PMI_491]